MKSVETYLKNLDSSQQAGLERVRSITKQVVPEAEEVISYGMPAFKYHKRILIYYAAHTHHMGIYPASDAMVETVGSKLKKFRTSKGTLQFTQDKPIPESLLKQIITFRQKEIDRLRK